MPQQQQQQQQQQQSGVNYRAATKVAAKKTNSIWWAYKVCPIATFFLRFANCVVIIKMIVWL